MYYGYAYGWMHLKYSWPYLCACDIGDVGANQRSTSSSTHYCSNLSKLHYQIPVCQLQPQTTGALTLSKADYTYLHKSTAIFPV